MDAHRAGGDRNPEFAFRRLGEEGEAPARADVVERGVKGGAGGVARRMGRQGEGGQTFALTQSRGADHLPARAEGDAVLLRGGQGHAIAGGLAIWAAGGDGGQVQRAGLFG